jgi:hypothetical protein
MLTAITGFAIFTATQPLKMEQQRVPNTWASVGDSPIRNKLYQLYLPAYNYYSSNSIPPQRDESSKVVLAITSSAMAADRKAIFILLDNNQVICTDSESPTLFTTWFASDNTMAYLKGNIEQIKKLSKSDFKNKFTHDLESTQFYINKNGRLTSCISIYGDFMSDFKLNFFSNGYVFVPKIVKDTFRQAMLIPRINAKMWP